MDREKVIKEFELFTKEFHPACTSEGVELDMFREVLAMLKEQGAQQVIIDKQCEVETGWTKRRGFCPKCHHVVLWMLNREYCGFCGQAVKWE